MSAAIKQLAASAAGMRPL